MNFNKFNLFPRHIASASRRRPLKLQCRLFTVLAVESSADDTCAAVVTDSGQILANVVIRQDAEHKQFGGIHPYAAIKAHQRNMPGAVSKALHDANMTVDEVDGIAFTRGPGIAGCLSVGSNAIKTLAAVAKKPLVGVHHMQAHALTSLLTTPAPQRPTYPFLTVLISGGHSLILLAASSTAFRILATTVDESIGRSYDKVARLLSLPATGAALEAFCGANLPPIDLESPVPVFPVPMRGALKFSYTCLHSAVERQIHARGGAVDDPTRIALAHAFQTAAAAQLEEKLSLALFWCRDRGVSIRHVVVSGGVASNMFLRERLRGCINAISEDTPISLICPPPALCTDNAVMIAWASMERFLNSDTDDYAVEILPKWGIDELTASRRSSEIYIGRDI